MSSLLEKGVWSRLSSIANEIPAASWLSLNTGTLPGQHGSYNYLELERGTLDLKRKDSHSCCYLPSMLTGLLAARNIMDEQNDLWEVNTERSYYEEFISKKGIKR